MREHEHTNKRRLHRGREKKASLIVFRDTPASGCICSFGERVGGPSYSLGSAA